MPDICGVCSVVCDSGSGDFKCCVECKRCFHIECIKDDVETKKTRSASKDWICKDCRKPPSSTSGSNPPTASTALTKEFLVKVMEEFKRDMFNELQSFKKEMSELKTSLQFLSNAVDDSNAVMKSIQNDITVIKKENVDLKEHNNSLENEVVGLKERLRSLEQYSRRTNIEISGIPETPREDVLTIVKDVGTTIGVEFEEGQVTAAHRIPSYNRDRIPSLVVQFHAKVTRDIWISKYKEKKIITAQNINSAYPPNRVYINEHLSPENKQTLAQLKKKCKDIGYKFAWCRDGKMFARKSEGERCYKINSISDIDKLK